MWSFAAKSHTGHDLWIQLIKKPYSSISPKSSNRVYKKGMSKPDIDISFVTLFKSWILSDLSLLNITALMYYKIQI